MSKTDIQQACQKTRLQQHKINFGLNTQPVSIFDPKQRVQYLSKNETLLG